MKNKPVTIRVSATALAAVVPWLRLVKLPLCLPIALSAGFGYFLHKPLPTPAGLTISLGVLCLATGAAGLNSIQEIETDRYLHRTKTRPLVTGKLTRKQSIPFITSLLFFGLYTIYQAGNDFRPLLLSILSVVVYNGIYTPLKKVTLFALIPGGIAGGLPPLIGWVGAGGLITDFRIWLVFFLFFLWQIPHFFLVLLQHKKDYQRVGTLNLAQTLSEQSLIRLAIIWMLAFSSAALSLTVVPDFLSLASRFIMSILTMGSTIYIVLHLSTQKKPNYRRLFLVLNASLFLSMITVTGLQCSTHCS